METHSLKAEILFSLDTLIPCLEELLQRHNFSVTSLLHLKTGSRSTKEWSRYIVIRCFYPRENIFEMGLALPARKVLRCSILVHEISKTRVRIEITQSRR